MKKLLVLALFLIGCGQKSPAGLWTSDRSSCEVLPDQTLLYTEVKDVEVNGYRYGQKFTETRSRSTLYMGKVDFANQPSSVTVPLHSPSIMGEVPVRELKLEWNPSGRLLKVDGQLWTEKPVQMDKELYGWWKQKRESHWVLLSPGGSLVQVGNQIRHRGVSDYSRWNWLVGWSGRFEAFQGKFTMKEDDEKIESDLKIKGDEATMMSDSYERIKTPFYLNWDKDGHPQVP